jgi:hypothetical protein
VKLEKISGRRIKVDRNSSIGVAICCVGDIFVKFKSTSGILAYMLFLISNAHAVSATMQNLLQSLESSPFCKVLIKALVVIDSRYSLYGAIAARTG